MKINLGNVSFYTLLGLFITWISLLIKIKSVVAALKDVWPTIDVFLPSIFHGLGVVLFIGLMVSTYRLLKGIIKPLLPKERFHLLRERLSFTANTLSISHDKLVCWDLVWQRRFELMKLGIPCPEIRFPVNRRIWRRFLAWHATLSATRELSKAKLVMHDNGFNEILAEPLDDEDSL